MLQLLAFHLDFVCFFTFLHGRGFKGLQLQSFGLDVGLKLAEPGLCRVHLSGYFLPIALKRMRSTELFPAPAAACGHSCSLSSSLSIRSLAIAADSARCDAAPPILPPLARTLPASRFASASTGFFL